LLQNLEEKGWLLSIKEESKEKHISKRFKMDASDQAYRIYKDKQQ